MGIKEKIFCNEKKIDTNFEEPKKKLGIFVCLSVDRITFVRAH